MINCTVLILAINYISEIEDGAFNGLDNLITLNLDRNLLSTLRSGMFIGLPSLRKLSISRNKIKTIDSSALQVMLPLLLNFIRRLVGN